MALIKKISSAWAPAENKDLKVGETIEITDYTTLVRTGAAVLVDEKGNELPLPGEVFVCPVCTKKYDSLPGFIAHVNSHKVGESVAPKEESVKVSEPAMETSTAEGTETITTTLDTSMTATENVARAKRLEALAKAREVLRARRAGK